MLLKRQIWRSKEMLTKQGYVESWGRVRHRQMVTLEMHRGHFGGQKGRRPL